MIESLRLIAMAVLLIGAIVAVVRMIRAYSAGDMAIGFFMIAIVSLLSGLVVVVGDVGKGPIDRSLIFVTVCAFVSCMGASLLARRQAKHRSQP